MRRYFLLLSLAAITQAFGQNPLRPPIPGIPTVSFETAGFHPDSIQALMNQISDTPPNDFRGLVVIKDNQLAVEAYFSTYWRNTIHDIRSAGKSITAMLLGVAMKEGLVRSLDQNVYSFFSEGNYPTLNEDYQKITLRNLLNMSSGLDADTDDASTPGQAVNWIAKTNWLNYILSVPLDSEPGKRWVYADINAVLIGAIIEETSGMSLSDFAKTYLFEPLGIEQFYWYTNAANQTGAAGNLYLTTLDFAKLGMLIVNEGKWNNRQLLDPQYVQEVIASKAFDLSDDNPYADSYGLLWYKSQRTVEGRQFDYLFASGNGGNHLIVVPSEKMVIALTSSAYGQRYAHRRSYNIMRKILESME